MYNFRRIIFIVIYTEEPQPNGQQIKNDLEELGTQ